MKLKNIDVQKRITGFFLLVALLYFLYFIITRWDNQTNTELSAYKAIISSNSKLIAKSIFYAQNYVKGIESEKDDLRRAIKGIEQNLILLDSGGVYRLGNIAADIYPLSGKSQNKITQFKSTWADYLQNINFILENVTQLDSTATFYEKTDYGILGEGDFAKRQKIIRQTNPAIRLPLQNAISQSENLYSQSEDLLSTILRSEQAELSNQYLKSITFIIIILVAMAFGYLRIIIQIIRPIQKLAKAAKKMADGETIQPIFYKNADEMGTLTQNINDLSQELDKMSAFAASVGKGDFETGFAARSKKDKLGFALLNMRDNLKKIASEDSKRNWANKGMARFAEILQLNKNDIQSLSYNIISGIVQYLDANQGGIFTLETEGEETFLRLSSAYAYNKKKYNKKQVAIGEGLLGQAILEENTIHLKEIPDGYVSITSGLGEATPNALLIVPLKMNNNIFGAIEIASFNDFAPYQIEFLEKLSESISSTLSTVRSAERNERLLGEAQDYTEQLRSQEEEMRQNLEELNATQEEMHRIQSDVKEKEYNLNALINNTKDTILAIDSNYNIKVFNKTFYDSCIEKGISVFVGKNVFETFPDKEKLFWKTHFERALKGESFAVIENFKIIKKLDEAPIMDSYYEFSFNPIVNNSDSSQGVEGVSVVSRDITKLSPVRWDEYYE